MRTIPQKNQQKYAGLAIPYALHRSFLISTIAGVVLTIALPFTQEIQASQSEVKTYWDGQKYNLGWSGVVRQLNPQSCGIAVLTMILKNYYNKNVSHDQILGYASLGADGLTLNEFSNLASRFGVVGEWQRINLNDLSQLPLPAVLHLTSQGGHYVIMETNFQGFSMILDPANGKSLMPHSLLRKKMSGFIYYFSNLPEIRK